MDQSLSDAMTDDDDDDARSHVVHPNPASNPASRPVCIPVTVLTESPVDDGVYRRWDPEDLVQNPALDAAGRNTALSVRPLFAAVPLRMAGVARVNPNPMWSLRRSRAFPAPKPDLQRVTSTRIAVLDTIFDPPRTPHLLSKLSRSSSDGLLSLRGVSGNQ